MTNSFKWVWPVVIAIAMASEGGEVVKVGAQPSARVDCGRPGPGGVDCTVKRTAGTAAVSACWDLEITCNNAGVMSAHACGKLAGDQATTVVNMPVAGFSNQKGCDVPKAGAVKNLEVSLK